MGGINQRRERESIKIFKIPDFQFVFRSPIKKGTFVTEHIKGFDKLSAENQRVFERFLINFLAAQGLKARNEIVPVSVRFVREGKERYLRFDFMRGEKETWLHIRSAFSWD